MSPHSFDQIYNFSVKFFEISEAERGEVYAEIRDSYQMRPSYLMMLVLACLVAILGLLANSPAVVIGAMLISPLMSPFLSAGLALAIGDWELGKAAMRTILVSVLVAIFISVLAVAVSPLKEPTAEILARTNPNLLDLGIAFFSGCAGTYTLVSRKGITTIPGVAIATAVMPPLCVVGFGAYQLDPRIALGAASLFVTNLAAIIISAALLFFLASFRISEFKDEKPHWSVSMRFTVCFAILILLAVPLASALVSAAETLRLRKKVEAALTEKFKQEEFRARLTSGWSVTRLKDRGLIIDATVRTLTYFTQVELDTLTRDLERTLGEPVDLQLDQIQVRKGGLTEPVPPKSTEPKFLPVTDPVYFSQLSKEYLPMVELCVKTIGAEVEYFYLVSDQQGIARVEVIGRVETIPSAELLNAGRRSFLAQLESSPLSGKRTPEVVYSFQPTAPVSLPMVVQKGQPAVDPVHLTALSKKLEGFLAQTPKPTVEIEFADALQLDEGLKQSLRTQILKQLGLSLTVPGSAGDDSHSSIRKARIELLVV